MLDQLKQMCVQALAPVMLKARWRPAATIPLTDDYLKVKFGYDDEKDIKQHIKIVRDYTMSSFERLATLWQQVRYLDRAGIPGALVECGVWKGGSSGMMALAHLSIGNRPTRKIHLFDSFQGLPQPRAAEDGDSAV